MDQAELIAAIQKFFGDTARSPQETREGLEAARDEIEMFIDSIPD